jgi:lipopolysaccharide/colanic/teichoic acid biosynthesis glycosyltransferase
MDRSLIFHTVKQDKTLYLFCKRCLDIFMAVALQIVLLPLFVLIPIAIKLDSRGPVIFSQERIGLRRRTIDGGAQWVVDTFICYKFRTMAHNAESDLHQAFMRAFINNDEEGMADLNDDDSEARKLMKDPRVTRIGAVLRRTSLDELPQLWNILKGEMSLVGPRPPIPYEVEMYQPWHLRRLEALPGLTGYWQVTSRSSAGFDDMVRLDLWYIDHQSLWLDIKIIFLTPVAVLTRKGAC